MSSSPKPLPQGTRVNERYELLAFLGKGANGEVHRAYDEHLGIEVALKLLHPKDGQPATWDEAQTLERLRSDYLLPVYNADIVGTSDLRYITTPVMVRGDLAKAASPVGVTPRQACRWSQHLAHGLEKIHSSGLLHRDVKPENCYLDDSGKALLADLGMAYKVDSIGRAPANGTLVTVAPEALDPVDPHCTRASDIYSLAATVFFLLAGDYPVAEGQSRQKTRDLVLGGRRRKVRDLAPHVPIGLGRILDRSLSSNPAERAASPLEFANQLAAVTHHQRDWTRIPAHDGHLICLAASATRTARPIAICAVLAADDAVDVTVQLDNGRHVRKHEKIGVKRSRLPVVLRALIAEV